MVDPGTGTVRVFLLDDHGAAAAGLTLDRGQGSTVEDVTSVEIEQGLSTAQIARAVDVPIDTIRYYERVGLLPEPPRTTGAHRRYPPAMVDRLQFIRGAQRLGLRLAEIRDLLAVRDTGVCPCEPAELLLRRHLEEIEAEMRRLARLREDLTGMLAQMPGPACPDPEPGTWCPPVVP